jgi:ribulose-phosphate 3-epimerase
MKISASIYSSKERQLEALVAELETIGVDYVHVDCNDDPSVEDAIARTRAISELPIDLHIISTLPEMYYGMIQRQKVDFVTLQYEQIANRQLDLPDLGCKWGLAITTNTPISVFEAYADKCDFILFMTTTPGQSGGKFDAANFQKIRAFRRAYPGKRIHVDGGVNAEISFVLRNLGVFCSVSGSFLVNADSVAVAFLKLLVQKDHNHLCVRDVMQALDELPILQIENLEARPLLQAIEDYAMGYCLLVNAEGKLAGLVTNADLRRGVLKQLGQPGALDPHPLVNPSPQYIGPDITISEMLQKVKSLPFLVQFMPVVDGDHRLVGAVNFNNLILGEL